MFDTEHFLAIDTETTGTEFHHGCSAFAISACNQDEERYYWEFEVDPRTRTPIIDEKITKKVLRVFSKYSTFIFHNASFDIRSLGTISPRFRKVFENSGVTIHDTMDMAHIHDSKGPKGLKDLAIIHLDIEDDDEDDLNKTVKSLQLKVKSINKKEGKIKWNYASKGNPQFPGARSGFHKMDMWLPKAYALSDDFDGTEEEFAHLLGVCKRYAVLDAVRTAALYLFFSQQLEQDPESFNAYQIQQDCTFPLIDMEEAGLPLLKGNFEREVEEYQVQSTGFKRIMQGIVKDPEFNPDASRELEHWLFEHFEFEPLKTTPSGENYSTDKDTLGFLSSQENTFAARRFLRTLMQYKATNSALKYLKSYQDYHKEHVLYPNMNKCGTSTTRLSSSQPNGQNVSKGKEAKDDKGNEIVDEDGNVEIRYSLRRVFGPSKGRVWYAIDYDQLQIRIFAFLSGETSLIESIRNGYDFHSTVAKDLHDTDSPTKSQRKTAKYVNFGIIFGAGKRRVSQLSGDETAYDRYSKLYPNVKQYISDTSKFVRHNGFIRTSSGYPLTVPKNKAYAGVNYKVQGTEGDIVKIALKRIWDLLKDHPECKMILQVHDEFIFDAPKDYEFPVQKICQIMEEAGTQMGVECKAKPEIITSNWAEGKDLEQWTTSQHTSSTKSTLKKKPAKKKPGIVLSAKRKANSRSTKKRGSTDASSVKQKATSIRS
jgi:DNA polymerase I-like protein with 3'-5' exonuclease and polymerase domains